MRLELYLLLGISIPILIALWAQWRVSWSTQEGGTVRSACGLSGEETAAELLYRANIRGIKIEPFEGYLSDHYHAGVGLLRLNYHHYLDQSVQAVGLAAHETGHALQEADHSPFLALREYVVPWSGILGNASWILLAVGLAAWMPPVMLAAVALFTLTVLLQLLNLPLELNASKRGMQALRDAGLVAEGEEAVLTQAVYAAAWGPLAATLTSVLTLRYFFIGSGAFASTRR